MQIRLFFSALNIDDLGKKWGTRIFFALLTIANFFFLMFPIGDYDFTRALEWEEDFMTNPEKYMTSETIEMPFTTQNWLAIGSTLAFLFVLIIVAICYTAVFIYYKRPDKVVKKGTVIGRTILMSLFFLVIYPGFLFVFMATSFAFVAAMPVLALFLGSYLSGDYSFGASFASAFRLLKGNYFSVLLNFIIIFFVVNFLQYIVDMFTQSRAYSSIVCVLGGALLSYAFIVLGRLMGTIYLDAKVVSQNRGIVRNNSKL